jgi:hypothetical protein
MHLIHCGLFSLTGCSWLIANKPVSARTAFRYTQSLVRMIKKVIAVIDEEPPKLMVRESRREGVSPLNRSTLMGRIV